MCLRGLAVALGVVLFLAGTQAEAKKCNKAWKNNGNGNGCVVGQGNGRGHGNWNPALTNGNIRSNGQHLVNAWHPTGQTRAAAQHTLNRVTKATKHRKANRWWRRHKGNGHGNHKGW